MLDYSDWRFVEHPGTVEDLAWARTNADVRVVGLQDPACFLDTMRGGLVREIANVYRDADTGRWSISLFTASGSEVLGACAVARQFIQETDAKDAQVGESHCIVGRRLEPPYLIPIDLGEDAPLAVGGGGE